MAATLKLIDLPTDEAKRFKWAEGQKKYGKTFVGHPLEQLDEEFIDALNYVDEAARQGMSLPGFEDNIRDMRERLRHIYEYFTNQEVPKPPAPAVEPIPAVVAPEPAPTSFRVYFNQRGALPWSVDAGAGTREYTAKAIKLSGVLAVTHFDPKAGDNVGTPTAWFLVSDALMVQGEDGIEFVPV